MARRNAAAAQSAHRLFLVHCGVEPLRRVQGAAAEAWPSSTSSLTDGLADLARSSVERRPTSARCFATATDRVAGTGSKAPPVTKGHQPCGPGRA